MNQENLDQVIQYIEKNLDNKIDLKQISKIVGINDFIFQRVFTFLTGITFNDYVKKRRLSKAFEEIKNSNHKIIDIAMKYQYNSVSAFNRAFKNLFGITPTECRKGSKKYKIIPAFNFKIQGKNTYNFDFEIKDIPDIKLYCYHISSDDYYNLLYKIRKLYEKIQKKEIYQKFNESGMYGFLLKEKNSYHYYVGSKEKQDFLTPFTIKKGCYAIFKLNSRKQKDIIDLKSKIYSQWFLSTNYKVGKNTDFELYEKDYCYIYISIDKTSLF